MSYDLKTSASQSAYELGCVLRACCETAQGELPDHAPLLKTIAERLGPTLSPTDEGLDFGESVKPWLYYSDQPETQAALWAILLSDALQEGNILDLMDLDLTRLLDWTSDLEQARRSALLRAADICLRQR